MVCMGPCDYSSNRQRVAAILIWSDISLCQECPVVSWQAIETHQFSATTGICTLFTSVQWSRPVVSSLGFSFSSTYDSDDPLPIRNHMQLNMYICILQYCRFQAIMQ